MSGQGPPYVPMLLEISGAICAAAHGRDQTIHTPAPADHAIQVEARGDLSMVTTSLCTHCPRGEKGCCAAPPSYWPSDLGLVALQGHGDWLVEELQAGRLQALSDAELQPVTVDGACVYWRAGQGCTIEAGQRPPYCNYWLCGEALDLAGMTARTSQALGLPGALDTVRAVREHLWQRRHRLSTELAREVKGPLIRPGNPSRTRRNLRALAAAIRPLLDGCQVPGQGTTRYVGTKG